ncbi:MAG: hypothetical protein NWE93_06630 [Candidatus Bathyarchaeota archaeon]|nr:hypothetical protein [Candidatus Bathyarchaeota archaeon]
MDEYTDKEWCSGYSNDEYFLYVLCWAGWRESRQLAVWKEVKQLYDSMGKVLCSYESNEIVRLETVYPLPWQKKWLNKLVAYLTKNSLSTEAFVEQLKISGYENSRNLLQGIVETEAEKIVDCWIRDIVRLDAFPIDVRIRHLFNQYNVPVDSNFIIDCCKKNGIPVRPLARALYRKAEALKVKSCKTINYLDTR